jgi:hypothetical protein
MMRSEAEPSEPRITSLFRPSSVIHHPSASITHHSSHAPKLLLHIEIHIFASILLLYAFIKTSNMAPFAAFLLMHSFLVYTNGFLPSHTLRRPQGQSQIGRETPLLILSADKTGGSSDDSLEGDEENASVGPEKSRMADYVSRFLEKGETPRDLASSGSTQGNAIPFSSDDTTTATHLIAIPLDTSHELLLELESVQRAILYHCPILADACIPGATTRLPLLYVKAPRSTSAEVTRALSGTVKTLVENHIFQKYEPEEEEEFDEELLNSDGYRPLTMTFQSLEIDGSNNNVLNTVGLGGDFGTTKLQALVEDLKKAIGNLGWQASLPFDPHPASPKTTDQVFRPRIPFMELPQDFDDNLSRFKDESTTISDEDFEFLNSSEGGNGISPIFWCQWWDDVFGRNIRLKEIAIYPRSQGISALSSDLSYSMFYMPYETISLPDANSAIMRSEQKFQEYQDERMEEQQRQMSPEGAIETSTSPTEPDEQEKNVLMSKKYERLEQLYSGSVGEESGFMDRDAVEGLAENNNIPKGDDDEADAESLGDSAIELQQEASPDDFIDDWMKVRIKKAIDSQESEKARKPATKEMPPIAENPVFKAYKEGKFTPKIESLDKKKKDLGPYPSSGHFAGIWHVVSSPTGFAAEASTNDRSENLILRIDGTTAGGPILDPETKQKAAGGTWKILEGEDGEVKLRIRLVIPPKKERVIEMIGRVNRIGMGSTDIPMASKAFGIPHLEAMGKKSSSEDDYFMMCGGEVYVEDAITKKNRERIGEFSLTKIQGPKARSDYTITIPKPT